VNLIRYPGVDLAIFVEHAFGADQARGIEDDARIFGIDFEHRARLNIYSVFARLLLQSLRVPVRDADRELFDQLIDGRKDRRGVRELGKDHEPDGKKGRAARDRRIYHVEHAVGVFSHLPALYRVRQVGLAGGH
jgi:hypothetical protein